MSTFHRSTSIMLAALMSLGLLCFFVVETASASHCRVYPCVHKEAAADYTWLVAA
jgi:hypothetical protein